MKIFLVIGASSDIGIAYLRRLESAHRKGEAVVIAHYRKMSPHLEQLMKSACNVPIVGIEADLQKAEEIERLITKIKEQYTAPTHILHLAAGKFEYTRLRQLDLDGLACRMQVQVFSFAKILKEFLPVMAKKSFGRVAVMLSSVTLDMPPKFLSGYVSCKYALLGLMKAAAAEYYEKGICINGISPSMIETKFLNGLDKLAIELAAASSPQKRNMDMSELMSAIDFLLLAENSHMSGVNLDLSAGAR